MIAHNSQFSASKVSLISRGDISFPRDVGQITIAHVPSFLREDAAAEAWLAVLEGRNPESAVRSLVRRELKHRDRFKAGSQF